MACSGFSPPQCYDQPVSCVFVSSFDTAAVPPKQTASTFRSKALLKHNDAGVHHRCLHAYALIRLSIYSMAQRCSYSSSLQVVRVVFMFGLGAAPITSPVCAALPPSRREPERCKDRFTRPPPFLFCARTLPPYFCVCPARLLSKTIRLLQRQTCPREVQLLLVGPRLLNNGELLGPPVLGQGSILAATTSRALAGVKNVSQQ